MFVTLHSLPSNLQWICLDCGSYKNQIKSNKVKAKVRQTSPAETQQTLLEEFGKCISCYSGVLYNPYFAKSLSHELRWSVQRTFHSFIKPTHINSPSSFPFGKLLLVIFVPMLVFWLIKEEERSPPTTLPAPPLNEKSNVVPCTHFQWWMTWQGWHNTM